MINLYNSAKFIDLCFQNVTFEIVTVQTTKNWSYQMNPFLFLFIKFYAKSVPAVWIIESRLILNTIWWFINTIRLFLDSTKKEIKEIISIMFCISGSILYYQIYRTFFIMQWLNFYLSFHSCVTNFMKKNKIKKLTLSII